MADAPSAISTPIGIAASTDNLTATNAGVTTGETATQLRGLEFTPFPRAFSRGSTFTSAVTDAAGNAPTGTAALDVGGAGAPTVTGTHARPASAEGRSSPSPG